MPIKMVLNGFYRSGTTALWDAVRRRFTETAVLYEPLNSHLRKILHKPKRLKQVNTLHNLPVWMEYLRLEPGVRERFRKKHPGVLTADTAFSEISSALDVLHECGQDVFIQSNRLQFFLERMADRYGSEIIIMIRNPVDVIDSLERCFASESLFVKARRQLRYLGRYSRKFWHMDAFIRDGALETGTCRTLTARDSTPAKHPGFRRTCFASWLFSNLAMLRFASVNRCTIIDYDVMVNNPGSFEKTMKKTFGRIYRSLLWRVYL